ncbi:SoxR reducing system RseC family protein [Tolumonas osonensis]|uniref:Sigma-E factor negative regulatory protein RseC n=1 Tax=Tolumonas osonensis TaxID=675874 RepID=A0A841GNN4_9GAMM|nr:SoxR reducing system RseC family protein [Tolumonas osonensis]MBB6056400.1 sigma-E factor negative regulatory protein RseC [Tolumonas osonensis]
MIEAIATVVATKSGYVSVEYQRKSACGHCQHQSSCGISSGHEEEQEHSDRIIDIACSLPLEVGQQVRIGIPEKGLLKGALLVYILPLFFIMSGAVIGQIFSVPGEEWPAIAGAVLGGYAGFMLMRIRSARLTDNDYKPVILGITIPVVQTVQTPCH